MSALYPKVSSLTQQIVLILFTEDFPVRTLALQELEKAWKESEADYFSRSYAWPKRSSPSSYFLKMSQQSQQEGDYESLEKLPKWGMIVDGVLYPLQALERYIVEKDGSYWPTPTVQDSENNAGQSQFKRNSLSLNAKVKLYPTPDANTRGARKNQNGHQHTLQDAVGSGKLNPQWVAWLMGYPTEWTDLKPWAMQWFLNKQKKHLKS
jgi:DNA (cytosine-5)-methyltransferase 1